MIANRHSSGAVTADPNADSTYVKTIATGSDPFRRSAKGLIENALEFPQSLEAAQQIEGLLDALENLHASKVRVSASGNFQGRFDAVLALMESAIDTDVLESADYLFEQASPQFVPQEWIRALTSVQAVEDEGFVLPWNE